MLQSLQIENYALIRSLEIRPAERLNTVTGETGAGKSIMLGALGLLLGKRADTKVLFDHTKKCIIEGNFNIQQYHLASLFDTYDIDYEDECIIRREISPTGKSRAFVNDCVTNLDFLKRLGNRLMDVHSQHDTLQLGANHYQLTLIDNFAQNKATLQEYQTVYEEYTKKLKAYQDLLHEADQLKKEADYNRFLYEELAKASLSDGEQERLEEELKVLENSEGIKHKLNEALLILDRSEINAYSLLFDTKNTIKQISSFSPAYLQAYERLESTLIELKDLVNELENEESSVAYDPQKTIEVQERLSLIYKLQQKHQVADIAALLKTQESLRQKTQAVENLNEVISQANQAQTTAHAQLSVVGDALSKSRLQVIKPFKKQLVNLLAKLGMPEASIDISHQLKEPNESGLDELAILFSANKGIMPQPLKNAASGGEFSRLMFAIKYVLADKTALPTIVFDEIDTGISGEIAMQMAQMMATMAENHQVITITHLPQIAAKGHTHYLVYKDSQASTTSSFIKQLGEEERLLEIAQMIGGKKPSEKALGSAMELMKG